MQEIKFEENPQIINGMHYYNTDGQIFNLNNDQQIPQVDEIVDHDILAQAVLDRIDSISKIERTNLVELRSTEDLSAVQIVSDLHFGRTVNFGGEEVFNSEIADKISRSILWSGIAKARGRDIKHLIIAINGDLAEGTGVTYPSQPYFVDNPVLTQTDYAYKLLWDYIKEASRVFEQVSVVTVTGNHGSSKVPDPTADFDQVIYRYLAVTLTQMHEVGHMKNVKLTISPDSFINFAPNEHLRLHMRHKVKYLQIRTPAGRAKFLAMCADHECDAIISGHWHTASADSTNSKWNIVNGSIMGVNEYGEELTLSSERAQILLIFDRKRLEEVINLQYGDPLEFKLYQQ